jgi:hypothetical protein
MAPARLANLRFRRTRRPWAGSVLRKVRSLSLGEVGTIALVRRVLCRNIEPHP